MSELAMKHNANTERVILISKRIAEMELEFTKARDEVEELLMQNEYLEVQMSPSDYMALDATAL